MAKYSEACKLSVLNFFNNLGDFPATMSTVAEEPKFQEPNYSEIISFGSVCFFISDVNLHSACEFRHLKPVLFS